MTQIHVGRLPKLKGFQAPPKQLPAHDLHQGQLRHLWASGGIGWRFWSWQSMEAWSLQFCKHGRWRVERVEESFSSWYQRLDKAGNALTSLHGGPGSQLCEAVKTRGGYYGDPRTTRDALRKADIMEWSQPKKDCVLRAAELEDWDVKLQDLVGLFLAVPGIFHLGIWSLLCAIFLKICNLFFPYIGVHGEQTLDFESVGVFKDNENV